MAGIDISHKAFLLFRDDFDQHAQEDIEGEMQLSVADLRKLVAKQLERDVGEDEMASIIQMATVVGNSKISFQRYMRIILGPGWTVDGKMPKAGGCFRLKGSDTIRQVIILHRHGARFPGNTMPSTVTWPEKKKFWQDYNNFLTPEGSLQHRNLGKKLARRYTQGSRLFDGVPSHRVTDHVRCLTSNTQRTIMSAWSLLGGMFPEVPRYVSHIDDRAHLHLEEVEKTLQAESKSLGIAIEIEENTKDFMFHQCKFFKGYKQWKEDNILSSSKLKEWSTDPEYLALVDKTFAITGSKGFNKEVQPDAVRRLAKLKTVQTLCDIQNAGGAMLELPNEKNVQYTEREKALMWDVAEETFLRYFRPAQSDEVADGMGQHSASVLGHEIAHLMQDRIDGKLDLRFIEMSAHDTTVCALASLFGVDITHPWFTGHWLFELHEPPQGEPFVRCFYNYNPPKVDVLTNVARVLPFAQQFKKWNDLPEGDIPLKVFTEALLQPALLNMHGVLRGLHLHLKNAASTEISSLRDSIARAPTPGPEDLKAKTESIPEAEREQWKHAFEVRDLNHDGTLNISELAATFRRLDIHFEQDDLKSLLEIFDLDKNESICFDEFVFIMCTLQSSLLVDDDYPEDSENQHLYDINQDADWMRANEV